MSIKVHWPTISATLDRRDEDLGADVDGVGEAIQASASTEAVTMANDQTQLCRKFDQCTCQPPQIQQARQNSLARMGQTTV